MGLMEILYLVVMLSLCGLVIKSDLQEGMVYNKVLKIYLIIAILMDYVYYCYFHSDMVMPFIINSLVVSVTAIILFASHCFAGGDCKLLIVLVLLFPAKCYMSYANSLITVVFAIGVAIFYGYLFLFITSIYSLIKKKNKISVQYIKSHILRFLQSFLIALIYISGINLAFNLLSTMGINIPVWIVRIICIAYSWAIGRQPIFRKKWLLGIAIGYVVLLSVFLKVIPFSIYPGNYFLVVALLVCQITIKTGLYKELPVNNLKKGDILSMGTTLMMQNSRVRGLPQISLEDLRNRLTEDEVESVKRWAAENTIDVVTIVKKIPFAAFIALGFISYWIAWGLLHGYKI